MSRVALEAAFILLLLIGNGIFAMSEIAVVSSRRSRLDHLAKRGDRRARAALSLAEHPNSFLATVQIGITSVGILAGVFGGATIAEELGGYLNTFPAIAPRGEEIALTVVVVAITFLSLIVGELVPKRIALTNPERIAGIVAPGMRRIARVARPAVWLLERTSDLLLNVLRVPKQSVIAATDEEIAGMVASGARTGAFHPAEAAMVRRVFTLGDRRAAGVMTPRPDIVWVDLAKPPAEATEQMLASGHARFPAAEGSLDHLVGVLELRDVAACVMRGQPVDLRSLVHPPLSVPEQMPALAVLERFRAEQQQFAFVLDEYGGVEGIITLADLAESVVGRVDPDAIVKRPDGSLLVDGRLHFDEVASRLELNHVPAENFETVAGFVMARLERLPRVGDTFEVGHYRFEVVDMDGNRVDRLLVTRSISGTDSEQ